MQVKRRMAAFLGAGLMCCALAAGCLGCSSDGGAADTPAKPEAQQQAKEIDFSTAEFTTLAEDPAPLTSLRALTSSDDGKYLYAGYIKEAPKGVYKIDAATGEKVWHFQEEDFGYDKGVAVDSRGYVYAGSTIRAQDGAVRVYILDDEDGSLVNTIEEPIIGKVGVNGVEVLEKDDKKYLYMITNYGPNRVYCYDVTDVQNPVPSDSFGVDGYVDLKALSGNAAVEANYLAVTDDGTVYLTALTGNGSKSDAVLKLSADGKSIEKVADVPEGYGICIANGYMLVSTYLDADSTVEVLKMSDFSKVASIGNMGDNTFYSAVTVASGKIYIADQGYKEGSRILVSNEIEGL